MTLAEFVSSLGEVGDLLATAGRELIRLAASVEPVPMTSREEKESGRRVQEPEKVDTQPGQRATPAGERQPNPPGAGSTEPLDVPE